MGRRKGGAFLPLDVNFLDDERIIEVGERPAWLYLAMCLKAKALLTDGILSETQIARLHVPGWQNRLARLHALELVWPTEDGRWWITAWDKHNDRAETVQERRERDAERKRSERSPNGVRLESERREEKRREEKSGPDGCPHGADRSSLCALCRRGIESESA